MLRTLKNSVAIPLIIALAAPGAAFSQDVVVDCDPATDPECIVPETGAEPTAETSEEEAPAEEVEVQLDEAEPAAEEIAEPETPQEDAASAETQSTEEATSEGTEEVTDAVEPEMSEPAPEDGASGTAEAETSTTEAEAAPEAEPETQEPVATSTETETGDTAEAPDTVEVAGEPLPIEEPETVLSEDTGLTEEAAAAEAAAAEEITETAPVAAAAGGEETSQAGAEPEVEVTTVTEESARTSDQEFSAKSEETDGLSTLEKLLIVGVGAAVVGGLIQNNRIVQNTGDRVVLQRDDGSLYVLRDDDVLLRRPGYEVATRTYSDGSTLSEITKSDGSIVRTIRDPRGRVLQRTRVLPSGREIMLFDDTAGFDPVVVEDLPLRRSSSLDYAEADAALADALSADLMADVGRRFSLSQIRNIRAVRELVPVIDLEAITFDTNSAAIRASEARKLDRLGSAMTSVIDERPWEVFLIEGHTDAVGSAVANLTLSDRRAESLALALTEYYGIPSENLVVQGYGERYLKVPVETDERANRRVTVRRITPLLGMEVDLSDAGAATRENTAHSQPAPSQLALFGNGYPNAGDPCLRAGESAFTSQYLDHTMDLVACPPSTDAGLFASMYGGKEVTRVDGWILFSVPSASTSSESERAPDAMMPSAGSPTDVTDFVGARAGQAEGGLQALGFEAIRSEGLTTYWFNQETGACARITTSDGRYSEIVMLPAEDC